MRYVIAGCVALFPLLMGAASPQDERGRYLVQIGGCNDCHTPNYRETDGKVPESQWLTGNPVGFKGPWGITYAANLRLVVSGMSEAQWMQRVTHPLRPPMPWFNLAAMTEPDRRAVYNYIRSLGAAGKPAPAYVAPGQASTTPYIELAPPHQAAGM